MDVLMLDKADCVWLCLHMQVRELNDQAVMDVECLGTNDPGLEKAQPTQLCFIAFLPDILDSKAEGRNEYINALKGLAADYKDRWVCACVCGAWEGGVGRGCVCC
jgi:protein disulfide-isomerase A6